MTPANRFPSSTGAQTMSARAGLSRRSGRFIFLLLVLAVTGCSSGNDSGTIRFGPIGIDCLAFSPDGKMLAVGRGPAVTLWDAEAGTETGRLPDVSGAATCLAYRRDGRW